MLGASLPETMREAVRGAGAAVRGVLWSAADAAPAQPGGSAGEARQDADAKMPAPSCPGQDPPPTQIVAAPGGVADRSCVLEGGDERAAGVGEQAHAGSGVEEEGQGGGTTTVAADDAADAESTEISMVDGSGNAGRSEAGCGAVFTSEIEEEMERELEEKLLRCLDPKPETDTPNPNPGGWKELQEKQLSIHASMHTNTLACAGSARRWRLPGGRRRRRRSGARDRRPGRQRRGSSASPKSANVMRVHRALTTTPWAKWTPTMSTGSTPRPRPRQTNCGNGPGRNRGGASRRRGSPRRWGGAAGPWQVGWA